MLQSIKGSLTSPWLRYSLFGVLIMSFGVWGIGDVLRRLVSPVNDTLVEGRGILIDKQLFARAWQRATAAFRVQGLENEQLLAGPLPGLLLERLIARALLQKETERLKLTVPPTVLKNALAANPLFAGEDGKFAGWQFAAFLRKANLSEEAYLEELRNNLLETSLLDNLTFGIALPQSFVRYLLSAKREQRKLEVIRIPLTRTSAIADPGDKKLQNFIQQEESLFRLPEYRRFAILTINPNVEENFDEATLRTQYEARKETLRTAERRSYSQLFFVEETLARKVMQSYKNSKNLQQAAREANSSPPIALVEQSREEILDDAIANGVFSIPSVGNVVLVEGNLGWYLIRLDALIPKHLASFESLRAQLGNRLALEQVAEKYASDVAQAEDMLLTGASLEEIAETIGAKVDITLLMDAGGRIQENEGESSPLSRGWEKLALADNEEASLLELGFSLSSEGEIASGFEIFDEKLPAGGKTIFLELQELQEDKIAELKASNRSRVLEVYRGLKQRARTLARADMVADSARQNSMETTASKEGLALRRVQVTREVKNWHEGFLDALFVAQIGDVLTTFGDKDGEQMVVRLAEISRPTLKSLTLAEVEAFTSELGEDRGLPLAVYRQVLQTRAELRINEQVFGDFISQDAAQRQSP